MAKKTIKQRFIIDKSGSMQGQQRTVIDGFNEQLQDMAREEKEQDVRYLVSLTMFSHDVVKVFTDLPLAEVPRLTKKTYDPDGSTALFDAIGSSIDRAAPGETDVIVTIMTDGQENASTKWKQSAINTLIKLRQDENKWGFVFFGANQDAWKAASGMGIANAVNYTVANTGLAMNAMSMARSCYTSSAMDGTYKIANLTANINQDDLVK